MDSRSVGGSTACWSSSPASASGPPLYVDWGWRDWLEPDEPAAKPLIVTPRFVAEAVRFALARGWQPVAGGGPLRLGFESGDFSLATDSA